jgi:hypothetical protein
MHHLKKLLAVSLVGLPACAPYVLAPGAADVRLTNLSADVSSCTAVGNVQLPTNSNGVDLRNAQGRLKNQAIGLGANVVLVTEGLLGTPTAGVAYRCAPRAGT